MFSQLVKGFIPTVAASYDTTDFSKVSSLMKKTHTLPNSPSFAVFSLVSLKYAPWIDKWVQYHSRLVSSEDSSGSNEAAILIFWDAPKDQTSSAKNEKADITTISKTEKFGCCFYEGFVDVSSNYETILKAQEDVQEVAISFFRKRGIDYLFFIDGDEVIFPLINDWKNALNTSKHRGLPNWEVLPKRHNILKGIPEIVPFLEGSESSEFNTDSRHFISYTNGKGVGFLKDALPGGAHCFKSKKTGNFVVFDKEKNKERFDSVVILHFNVTTFEECIQRFKMSKDSSSGYGRYIQTNEQRFGFIDNFCSSVVKRKNSQQSQEDNDSNLNLERFYKFRTLSIRNNLNFVKTVKIVSSEGETKHHHHYSITVVDSNSRSLLCRNNIGGSILGIIIAIFMYSLIVKQIKAST